MVQKVLRRHSDALRQAALAILKSESLTGQEIRDIMAEHPPHDPPHTQVCLAVMVNNYFDTAWPKVSDADHIRFDLWLAMVCMLSCSCLTNRTPPR